MGRISGEFCRADPLKHRIAKHRDFHVISYEHAIPVTSNVPLSVGSSKSIVKSWVEYRSSNNDTYREVGGSTLRDQVNRLSHERGKRDTFGFLMTSPRLEEVENLLMSFSPPGGKRPPAVNFG